MIDVTDKKCGADLSAPHFLFVVGSDFFVVFEHESH